MIEVFDPFKVGHANTSRIGEHIRYDHDSFLLEIGMCIRSNWTVCSFNNELCVDILNVVLMDGLFLCTETENVAFEE
jgi:hypothetical protein